MLLRGRELRRRARAVARLRGDTHLRRDEHAPEDSLADRAVRQTIWRWVNPRWQRHLERILERERDVDAVVVFTVPMSHLRGIPTALRERFGVPVVFYDADVPMSLPEFGGMDTGFNIYHGADTGRVRPRALELRRRARAGCASSARAGRRRSSGAPTPSSSRPCRSRRSTTCSSTATASSSGASFWSDGRASRAERLPDVDVRARGRRLRRRSRPRARARLPARQRVSRAISAARVNVNVGRRPHADGAGVVHEPAVRDGLRRRGDRDQPVRGRSSAGSSPGRELARRCTPRTRPSRPTGSSSTTRPGRRGARRRRPRAGARGAHVRRSARAGCST